RQRGRRRSTILSARVSRPGAPRRSVERRRARRAVRGVPADPEPLRAVRADDCHQGGRGRMDHASCGGHRPFSHRVDALASIGGGHFVIGAKALFYLPTPEIPVAELAAYFGVRPRELLFGHILLWRTARRLRGDPGPRSPVWFGKVQ